MNRQMTGLFQEDVPAEQEKILRYLRWDVGC
jgi:hypothetical protein